MKKFLRKLYNRGIKRMLPDSFRNWLKNRDSLCYTYVKNPEDIFEIAYHIKDATWESMEMPEIYGMSKRYAFTMKHPAQNILYIPNARIVPESDVVLTKHGIVWDKYYLPMFPYMEVADSNVASHDSERAYIRKPEKTINIEGACLSLHGVCAKLWVHFIIQFLPKLYYAEEAGILDKDITLAMPDYKDAHINQLISDVLLRHPKCKVKRIDDNSQRLEIACDALYWIPTTAAESNSGIFPMLLHHVVPHRVMDILMNKVFAKYIEKVKPSPDSPEKIYLVRRGIYRSVQNLDEIENFFRQEGFVFVEPHKMPLQEKINLFRNAKVVAGSHSSAWGNVMLCNGAKGIMLTALSWTMDGLMGYMIPPESCKVIQVLGFEDYVGHQSDYYISLDALKQAYKQILSED